jgi:uncharacterized protein (DUF433 family)
LSLTLSTLEAARVCAAHAFPSLLILESFAAGMTIAQIVDAYPSLTEESVRGVLGELARRKDLQPV